MKSWLTGLSLTLFMVVAASSQAATEVRLSRERLELPRHIILYISNDTEGVFALIKSRLENEGFKIEKGGEKEKSSVTVIKGKEVSVVKNIKTYATPWEMSLYYKKKKKPEYIEWVAVLKDRRNDENIGIYKYVYTESERGVKWSNKRVIADMVNRFVVTVFED